MFRDYLNAHPDAAKVYEAVKIDLMDKFKHDRLSYTNGKHACVVKMLVGSQDWSGGGDNDKTLCTHL
jgi:GrpB-like predicted nucleotidyltransferase (UPF0157 family)